MQRHLVGALVVAVLALAAGGCGGGSKPLSAAQLRTQASAVCKDMTRRIRALEASSTQTTLHASLARAAVVMTDEIQRLEALKAPDQLIASYDRFVAWTGSQRDAMRDLAHPGRRLSARSRRAVEAHASPARVLARQLGIVGCA